MKKELFYKLLHKKSNYEFAGMMIFVAITIVMAIALFFIANQAITHQGDYLSIGLSVGTVVAVLLIYPYVTMNWVFDAGADLGDYVFRTFHKKAIVFYDAYNHHAIR